MELLYIVPRWIAIAKWAPNKLTPPGEQEDAGDKSNKSVTQETDLINALCSCILDKQVLWTSGDGDLKHMQSKEKPWELEPRGR